MRILPQSAQNLPIPPQAHPQYRYPSQKHLTPERCAHCGARLLAGDVPTADAPIADLSCLHCTRVAAVLVHDSMRAPMKPSEFKALPSIGKRGPIPASGPAPVRLVNLLKQGGPVHPEYLMARLGMTLGVLRNAVCLARQAGHRIISTPQGYRLDGAP